MAKGLVARPSNELDDELPGKGGGPIGVLGPMDLRLTETGI